MPSILEDSDRADGDRAASATALAIAAVSLGYALQVSNGNLHPTSILWLTVAIASCVAAVVVPRISWLEPLGTKPVIWILGVGFVLQLVKLLTDPPAMYLQLTGARSGITFVSGLAVAGVLAGAGLSKSPWLGRLRMPLLLLTHFVLGVWLIRNSPMPSIDVFFFQRDGLAALLHGINPYSITYPDIYGGGSPFYGPGLSLNGRTTFGFPYPPLSLVLAAPGSIVAGDFRYAQLTAMTASGALMTYARPGRLGAIAASVFLFTPRVFFVLEEGWTEPFVVLLLAATVFAACRIPRFLPIMLGLLFSSKQYLVWVVPLVALLVPRPFRVAPFARLLGKAAVVALAITLPFALWGLPAFIRDVVTLQLAQPFRSDSLSYLAWFANGSPHPPSWLAFAVAALAAWASFARAIRTPSGFAGAFALTFVCFFAFNKQAFCNYYFLVIGACCIAISASQWAKPTPSAA